MLTVEAMRAALINAITKAGGSTTVTTVKTQVLYALVSCKADKGLKGSSEGESFIVEGIVPGQSRTPISKLHTMCVNMPDVARDGQNIALIKSVT